ncbi:hypothetical protein BpHYR1_037688 [Brachionus plicatilis]|uniref:Uncharacterized protein n=1 Tax=Brachionus plicatilis TaxID=10195 RepID=A0A3M7QKV5_BRAPC|nr:hypothetical protein BpHYR1_037688 [Brachionus plicatilis]
MLAPLRTHTVNHMLAPELAARFRLAQFPILQISISALQYFLQTLLHLFAGLFSYTSRYAIASVAGMQIGLGKVDDQLVGTVFIFVEPMARLVDWLDHMVLVVGEHLL